MNAPFKAMPYIDGRADDEREDTACYLGDERIVEVECYVVEDEHEAAL